MNPNLLHLQTYPFEKLARLKKGCQPPGDRAHIALSIGEPKHAAPAFIIEELVRHLHGVATYPTTRGSQNLRTAIANWLTWRFHLPVHSLDPERHILPVNGTREALFAIAQAVVDRSSNPLVLMPNPFYQIYEGATLLAGAIPWYLNTIQTNGFLPDFEAVPENIWRRCQLVYLCTPGNPTGTIINQQIFSQLIERAHRYEFVIASDECYSEIYFNEDEPPLGLLEAAAAMGNSNYSRCLVFHSLSKRSNLPGLRSGFVAGDAGLIQQFYRYRTYHGCAMPPPVQAASVAAWGDEEHVQANRALYREKFRAVRTILKDYLPLPRPPASFYFWAKTPIDDTEFARQLFIEQNVTVLPGSYLSRNTPQGNPGERHVRMAWVAPLEECIEAARRIRVFLEERL